MQRCNAESLGKSKKIISFLLFYVTSPFLYHKLQLMNPIRKTMKTILALSLSMILSTAALAYNQNDFPTGPNLEETPGKLCSSVTEVRYPEKIAYCSRDVDSYLKRSIIAKYDQMFGYHIENMKRMDFKIDHLIPLCAGGANSEENLWPQHKSVYKITDPLEPLLCQKMQEGKLLQADAVKMVIFAKTHLDQVPVVMKKLRSL